MICGIQETRIIFLMRAFDFLTVIRIPGVLMSCLNTRGLRCYYKYRVLTMFLLILLWITSFVLLILKSLDDQIGSSMVVIVGIGGGTILVFDYYLNKILKRHLLRTMRKDQIFMIKIKGRMLQQKEHKGSIRIDTPPPNMRSDIRSVGSRRSNRLGAISSGHVPANSQGNIGGASSSRPQSQKVNYTRTKTLHRARSDSSLSQMSI